ncbi:MAG: EAL domain-containing protein [Lautropia sp.]|nr:EAL domain-containing protein [Lautropia sp.]
MAKRKSRQFYSHQVLGPRRLVIFGLPTVVASLIVLGYFHGNTWLNDYLGYVSPVILCAVTLFSYGLLKVSLELREQSRINRRLKEVQAQHGLAEGLARMGSWVLDIAEDRFYWSEGCFQVFDLDPAHGAPSRQAFFICIHPEDQQGWKDAHRRAVRQGEQILHKYRYKKPNGEVIWISSIAEPEYDSDGKHLLRLAGSIQDITQAERMQAERAASEQKYKNLTELSSDWEWAMNANFLITQITGRVDADLKAWSDHVPGHFLWDNPGMRLLPNDWAKLKASLQAREAFKNLRFTVLAPTKELYTIQLSGRPTLDADTQQFNGYHGVGRNVTLETKHDLLLALESKFAELVREHDEESDVITGTIRTVCQQLGWHGGAMLALIESTQSFRVQEHWGNEAITAVLGQMTKPIPILNNSCEKQAWEGGAVWLDNTALDRAFSQRYETTATQSQAAFITPIMDEKNKVLRVLIFFSPISYKQTPFLRELAGALSRMMSLYLQRKNAEDRLRRASQHDALTGLPNRAFLTEHLERRLAKREPLALLYIDLDRYKAINDTLGHQAGDQVLIEVSQRFKSTIGPNNIAARMGGDEFVLLLDKQNNAQFAEDLARQVLAAVERPFILKGRAHFLSASIGIALSPLHGSDASTLIRCADNAMYTVKSEGRNDVRLYTQKDVKHRDPQQLTADLPLAMERGEVELHYQPVISVHDNRVVGMEGLIRWRHPTLGILMPDAFLPLAEQSNLMREVGLWTIRRALDDRIKLGLGSHDDLVVSVNISPTQMNEDDFLTKVQTLLSERKFPPKLLRLELVENTLIEGSTKTINRLNALRRLGVEVVVDNFGTGYASLSYLRNLPVSGLKIDHTFVKGLPADKSNAAIIHAIMTLAEKLGLKVIAEGVSSREEMLALRDVGCSRMQGNFISRPLTMVEMAAFLQHVRKPQAAATAPARPTKPAPNPMATPGRF